jgi:dephospho-CoA kinase
MSTRHISPPSLVFSSMIITLLFLFTVALLATFSSAMLTSSVADPRVLRMCPRGTSATQTTPRSTWRCPLHQRVFLPLFSSRSVNSDHQPTPFHPLRILGVCGPIGSGKSYACSLLVSHLNCTHHIDADSLAHGLYDASKYPNNRHLIQEIQREFGPQVLHEQDGTVNRQVLGSIVFSDSTAMARLEHIVWPHLKQRLIDRLREIQKTFHTELNSPTRPVVVVEAAVLIDTNWDDDGLFDAIWAMEASTDTSAKRLVDKRGMRQTDALQRIAAQQGRRGIGNLLNELERGVVTAKIVNDIDCHDSCNSNSSRSSLDLRQRENILLERLKHALMDPSCWKPGRYPSL